jgi:hypothetical protein
MQLDAEADGLRTRVSLDTDLKISGKIAQMGGGMIAEVSQKLLGQFAQCLESKLAAPVTPEVTAQGGPESPEVAAGGELPSAPGSQGSPSGAAAPGAPVATEAPEPLDLMGLAAGSMLKRVLPVLAVIIAIVVVVVLVLAQ